MIFEEVKQIKTGKKELKSFAITFGILFLIVAGLLIIYQKDYFQWFAFISTLFFIFGFIYPVILKPIYLIWMTFAVILGSIMTRVILTLLFYSIITPISVLGRIFGKKFLEYGREDSTNSYWNLRDSSHEKNQNYEKQY